MKKNNFTPLRNQKTTMQRVAVPAGLTSMPFLIRMSIIFARRIILVGSIALMPFQVYASDEWSWTTEPTPGASNTILNEEGEVQENYSNGTLSDDILLSEIMPNPEGTDTDVEWIEIYNSGNENVDLGNWSLDDEEEGSAPYIFPAGTVIEAQDFLVIYRLDSDISLNNDTDQVRLFDFQGTIKDEVTYETSPEGQSYARIGLEELAFEKPRSAWIAWFAPAAKAQNDYSLNNETPWQWTAEITKGSSNPLYYRIKGQILEVLAFENKIKLDRNGKSIEISLAKLNLNENLKTSLFQSGNTINGYAALNPENIYELIKLEDTQTTVESKQPESNNKVKILLMLVIAAGASGMFYYKKFRTKTL